MIYCLLNFLFAAFKLIEGEDVERIEAKIERYVNENMELIETHNNQRVKLNMILISLINFINFFINVFSTCDSDFNVFCYE